jgi:hypothetical protein
MELTISRNALLKDSSASRDRGKAQYDADPVHVLIETAERVTMFATDLELGSRPLSGHDQIRGLGDDLGAQALRDRPRAPGGRRRADREENHWVGSSAGAAASRWRVSRRRIFLSSLALERKR